QPGAPAAALLPLRAVSREAGARRRRDVRPAEPGAELRMAGDRRRLGLEARERLRIGGGAPGQRREANAQQRATHGASSARWLGTLSDTPNHQVAKLSSSPA